MSHQYPMQKSTSRIDRRAALASGLGVAGALTLSDWSASFGTEPAEDKSIKGTLNVVVMDPLAAPLACDCVKGYANRQYQRLAERLESSLNKRIQLQFTDSLSSLKQKDAKLSCDMVIGKCSVVAHQSQSVGETMKPVASLTDKEGRTTQRGMFAVRSSCPAATLLDLDGAVFYFGSEDCDEKWAAPKRLLEQMELAVAPESKSFASCSEAAKALLQLPKDALACAIISSYAAPLLEGCGTIQRGDLKIIGQTEELPFVTAFVNQRLNPELREAITKALCQPVDSELQELLETEKGFQPYAASV